MGRTDKITRRSGQRSLAGQNVQLYCLVEPLWKASRLYGDSSANHLQALTGMKDIKALWVLRRHKAPRKSCYRNPFSGVNLHRAWLRSTDLKYKA